MRLEFGVSADGVRIGTVVRVSPDLCEGYNVDGKLIVWGETIELVARGIASDHQPAHRPVDDCDGTPTGAPCVECALPLCACARAFGHDCETI